MSPRKVAYLNARLIDPASGLDANGALLTLDGAIADLGPRLFAQGAPSDAEAVDCRGLVLAPGLIDMRVFTGEPGGEHRETLATASAAAAAGGVTTIIVMPNTDPVIDDVALVDFIARRARDAACVNVLPMAALTKGLKGAEMTEIGLLAEAGAVGFSDGDRTVMNAQVMRRALSYAANFGALVAAHAEDANLACGHMNDGEFAMRLGLAGSPPIAETVIVERDLRLVEATGARYHLMQVSTRAALDAVAAAKARGLPVTCGVSACHLTLNELDIGHYLTFMKLRPPLRSEDDRRAMVQGLAGGVIDVVVSGHDPQAADTKRLPFAQAAYGAIGLETLLPAMLQLVHAGDVGLAEALRTLTIAPARILGLPSGRLAKGAPADLVLIDAHEPFVADRESFRSKAKNSPYDGRRLQGRAVRTVVAGRCVFERTEG